MKGLSLVVHVSVMVGSAAARFFHAPAAAAPHPQKGGGGEESTAPPPEQKKRVLMLISDTGGGHRASAAALEAMMLSMRPKGVEVEIVDIWTHHGAWPHSKMAAGYPFMCKHSWMWWALYHASANPISETGWLADTRLRCGGRFKRCIQDYDPDLVVSLHPLCQHLPLRYTHALPREGGRVPFATVCTDLGGAHPSWFVKGVDACFVPSDAVHRIAERRGVDSSKIRQHGLPVRRAFWKASDGQHRMSDKQLTELGLLPNKKTVLVAGGGDGVGSLEKVVKSTAERLAADCPDQTQVVALCGKNAQVRERLEARKGDWSGVNVEVRGFTPAMSAYMEAADCIVTKAGPGTIAEAAIRGLPTMLSSFLPGQEFGNVAFVESHGFGAFSKQPTKIAQTVSSWLQDDRQLSRMQAAARSAATPEATKLIATDLLKLLDDQSVAPDGR